MSLEKRIVFGVGVSWLSRIITILANLLLIPIMFRYLGKEELGVWFLLSSSTGLLGLLGMGITPIITRKISLAKGKSGGQIEVELTSESKQEIGDLVTTSKILLRGVAFFIFFVASIGGYFFINKLDLVEVPRQTIFWSWLVMCGGHAIGVWVEYLNCLLTGMGYVGFNQLIITFLSLSTVLINIIVVISGGGLFELAIVLVFTNLAQRLLLLEFIRKYKPYLLSIQGKWNIQEFKNLIKPALDNWLSSISAFLILRADLYFIGTLIGVSAITAYQANYQLVSNLRTLSVSLLLSSIPFISQIWEAGELIRVHQIVKKICLSGLLILSIGTSFLLVSGSDFVELWIGKDSFVGYGILITFCVTLFFETQNSFLVHCARATGFDKYAIPSMIAGFLNIILTILLIKPLGLLGVPLATLISLMLTENWYSLYKSLSRLKLSLQEYLKTVILIVLVAFILNYIVNLSLKSFLVPFFNQTISVILTMLFSLLIFLFIIWNKVLDDNLKLKLMTRINLFHSQ